MKRKLQITESKMRNIYCSMSDIQWFSEQGTNDPNVLFTRALDSGMYQWVNWYITPMMTRQARVEYSFNIAQKFMSICERLCPEYACVRDIYELSLKLRPSMQDAVYDKKVTPKELYEPYKEYREAVNKVINSLLEEYDTSADLVTRVIEESIFAVRQAFDVLFYIKNDDTVAHTSYYHAEIAIKYAKACGIVIDVTCRELLEYGIELYMAG